MGVRKDITWAANYTVGLLCVEEFSVIFSPFCLAEGQCLHVAFELVCVVGRCQQDNVVDES